MRDALASLDATAQAELVARGELTARELVDAAIARIERLNPQLNAVITPLFEKARAQAAVPRPPRGPSTGLSTGPFTGVPFLLKDLDACSAGDSYHCGMRALRELEWVEDHDSYVTEKFRAAGLIAVGKSNTPELGLSVTTEPVAYGPCRNPWSLAHSAGGSSGGSAAAVAAGLVPIAHASDGGGSIRIPASECGLVGLKPSRGRVSLGPEFGEYWHGLVINHVVSRSVRDSAAALDAIAGPMPGDPYVAPAPQRPFLQEVGAEPGTLRIGTYAGTLHPDCAAAVAVTSRVLAGLGHRVEASHPPPLDDVIEVLPRFMVLVSTWTARALERWSQRTGREIGARDVEAATWAMAELGHTVTGTRYLDAVEWLQEYTRRLARWWSGGFDLLITPTMGEPPPRIGALTPPPNNPLGGQEKALPYARFTPPFNITGQPALSLPLHWNGDGLPIGVQLVAAYGREDLLFRVAAQLESAQPWATKRPPIHAAA